MTELRRLTSRPAAATGQLGPNEATLMKAYTTKIKIANLGGLGDGENDDLIEILKKWDVDGDGQFSTGELILAAKELNQTRIIKDEAVKKKRLYRCLTLFSSVALVMLIAVLMGVVVVAIQLTQETTVEESDGGSTMMAKGSSSKVIGTASVSDYVSGLSGLFKASAQTLEELSTVNFYHGGDYIQLAVSQVVRGSQRILVYGSPGVLTINQDDTMLWSESGPGSDPVLVDDVGPPDFQLGRRLGKRSNLARGYITRPSTRTRRCNSAAGECNNHIWGSLWMGLLALGIFVGVIVLVGILWYMGALEQMLAKVKEMTA